MARRSRQSPAPKNRARKQAAWHLQRNNSTHSRHRGMTCASCVRRVERALGKVEGVETANVNFASETALVTRDAA